MDLGMHFSEYVPKPKSTQPVTNLAPHVDGGQGGSTGTNRAASADANKVLHGTIAIILVALMLLWMMGALAFRKARL